MKRSPGSALIAASIGCYRSESGAIVIAMQDQHGTVIATGTMGIDSARGFLGDMLALVERSEVEEMPVAGHA